MSAIVPRFPGKLQTDDLDDNDLRIASPVRGAGQWYEWANAAAWLAGHGAQLLSLNPQRIAVSPGSGAGFSCYTTPHEQIRNWLWIVCLSRTGANGAFGTFEGAQGTTLGTWKLDTSVNRYSSQIFFFVESFSSVSSPYTFTTVVENDAASAGSIYVTSVSAVELPAYQIATVGVSGTAEAVDPQTCANNTPIYEAGSGLKSAHGLAKLANDFNAGVGLILDARRAFHFGWSLGFSTGSSTYVDVGFDMPPPVLSRHLLSGVETGTVRIAALIATVGAPNTGNLRITAISGDVATISVSGAGPTWYTVDLSVDTEDYSELSTTGGLRDGDLDTLLFEARVTGGTTTLAIAAIHVVEPDA